MRKLRSRLDVYLRGAATGLDEDHGIAASNPAAQYKEKEELLPPALQKIESVDPYLRQVFTYKFDTFPYKISLSGQRDI